MSEFEVFVGTDDCAKCLSAWETERQKLVDRIERLEGRNRDWVKRITEAAESVAYAENYYRSDADMATDEWSTLSHAAKITEELERDMRSDLLLGIPLETR